MKTTSKLKVIVKPNRPVLGNNNGHNLSMIRNHIKDVRRYYQQVKWSSNAK